MGIIKDFAIVLLVMYGLKIVWRFYKRISSKETIDAAIDETGKKVTQQKNDFTDYLKYRVDSYRLKKQEEKTKKPTIIIR